MRTQPTILIVDDFASTRKVVRSCLERAGFSVLEGTNGKDAMKILNQNSRISLVVTDLNMPEMDGIQLTQEVRSHDAYGSVPILLLTTEMRSNRKEEALRAGATALLPKPFTVEAFLEVVQKMLR
ncbi:response regulator [Hugenholtzia roseola]|uniref:response regulator n=1 Tax=Hugenholtzia roseola TaxID=1002 RepID=UPI0004263A9F|nr:response regulator [Hugenholtzia roseola]